jgi:hypothetical protein
MQWDFIHDMRYELTNSATEFSHVEGLLYRLEALVNKGDCEVKIGCRQHETKRKKQSQRRFDKVFIHSSLLLFFYHSGYFSSNKFWQLTII